MLATLWLVLATMYTHFLAGTIAFKDHVMSQPTMAPLLWINKVCKADLVEPVRFESHFARWRRMSTTCLAVGFLNTAKVSIKANGFVNGHLSGEIGPTEAHYKQCTNFWHLDSSRNLAEREYSWWRGTYPWLSVFLTDQMGRIRGGVTFFYREGLICTIHVGDDLNYGNESLSLQVNRLRCRPRIIGCVYRPPNQCMDEFLGNMNYSLSPIHPNDAKVFPAILMLISHLPPEMQTFH